MKTQSESRKFEGQCKFCGQDFTKRTIVGHLDVCKKRKEKKTSDVQGLRLSIYDAWIKDFWLIVEVDKLAKFKELDQLIRDVWVECCGHLSMFGDYSAKIGKTRVIFDTVQSGDSIPYVYDFGTSTELEIKVLGYTKYKLVGKKHVEVIARNYMPFVLCVECDNKHATHICTECSDEQLAFLCKNCVKKHDEDKGCYILEIANSPRSGVCGYEPSESLDKLF